MAVLNPYVDYVVSRLKANKSCLGKFSGSPGSGKTYAAIGLCLEIAKRMGTTFTVEGNIAFDFPTLLKKQMRPENLKPGTVFVLEEVGSFTSGAASMTWQSEGNRYFSSYAQTSRHRLQPTFFTSPAFSDLMKSARGLMNCCFEMVSINATDKISRAKAFLIQTNLRDGKQYFKRMRCNINGERCCIPVVSFELPPRDIIEAYEKAKLEFTSSLNQQIIDAHDARQAKLDTKTANNVVSEQEKIIDLLGKGLTIGVIARVMNVSSRTVSRRIATYKTAKGLRAPQVDLQVLSKAENEEIGDTI